MLTGNLRAWLLSALAAAALVATPFAGAGHDGTNVFHLGQTNVFGNARVVGSAPSAAIGYFEQQSVTGLAGVHGRHSAAVGSGPGVLGETDAPEGVGVYGRVNPTSGSGAAGVFGLANGGGYGVNGIQAGAGLGYGVRGFSSSAAAGAAGVLGQINSNAANAAGVRGTNLHLMCCGFGVGGFHVGQGIGVYGESPQGFAVSGFSPDNWSGYFQGSVRVVGNLQKNSGSFTIDHPLDPQNKYLSHSFVESPDMMNVYNGNVRTNAKGFAVVKLPRYFGALNRDFRYQLTTIGQHADAWIAKEIANNRFTLRTEKLFVKVSWQVTGIRKDRWANARRIKVEEAKTGSEAGKYLNPELYGQPLTKSVVVLPGLMK